ncbi:MAG: AAA family ATPase [Crocinitomix sp.]|nr:AAA family ATPase [Crocinitomix sp.]
MASEVDQIIKAMQDGNHFLLSGGAGSGKTHTLIELIQTINNTEPKAKIACITYTNVAADEIGERANSYSMQASTIHDFLWDSIKGFQTNLRDAIIELYEDVTEDDLLVDKEIQYRDFQSLKKGFVSHDDVLILAKYLFEYHPLLSRILSDKFDYIFVDEYQDTTDDVISILFGNLNRKTFKLRIGLFGDSMQSIYDGIGSIDADDLISKDWQRDIVEIKKVLNRRSPQNIIDLANDLRSDDLEQMAKENSDAPNNKLDGSIKIGDIKFLYSNSRNYEIKEIIKSKFCSNWDFENFDKKDKPYSKILLTRNRLIAEHAGFESLFNIYEKDKMIGQSGSLKKRIKDYLKTVTIDIDTEVCTFLELINHLISQIYKSLDLKKSLALINDEIPNYETTQKAINKVNKDYPDLKKVLPTAAMIEFITNNEDLFDLVLNSSYSDVSKTFVNKDKLIGKKKSKNANSNKRNDERDHLIKFLYKIQAIIEQYDKGDISGLIKSVDFRIEIGSDKLVLKKKMDELVAISALKIEDVLKYIGSANLFNIDERTTEYMASNSYLLKRIGHVSFSELINLYEFTEGLSTYSTQHGVKGDEFDNVMVVISEEKISQLSVCYKFLFENEKKEEKYYQRTKNLFYVSCTRAKENLVVFFEGECSKKTIDQAIEWFGESNVIDLDKK